MVMLYTKLKHKAREIKDLTDMGLVDTHWLRDLEIFAKVPRHGRMAAL